MSLDIESVLRTGYERTVASNGLLFAAAFYALSVLDGLFSADVSGLVPADRIGGQVPVGGLTSPLSLGLPPSVAGVLSFLVGVVSLVVTVGALRTFVTDETETVPRERFTDDIVWTALNLVAGGIVFAVAVFVGFLLLVVPGVFLLVSLLFWEVSVAVEDRNFVDGFRESWALTGGRRLRLFALGVAVVVVAVVVSIVFAIPGVLLPPVLGVLVAEVGSALTGVFVLATLADTYNRLQAMADEDAAAAAAAA